MCATIQFYRYHKQQHIALEIIMIGVKTFIAGDIYNLITPFGTKTDISATFSHNIRARLVED